jgi:hypothetical protein
MAINDEIVNGYIKNNIYINRYGNELRKQSEKIIKKLEDAINSAILSSGINTRLVAKKQYELGKFNKIISVLIDNAFNELSHLFSDDRKFAESQSNVLEEVISNTLLTVVLLKKIDILSILGKTQIDNMSVEGWWLKQKQYFKNKLKKQMRIGVMNNETIEQLIYRFAGGTTERGEKYRGLLASLKQRSAALIKTTLNTISNNVLDANHLANSELIVGYQHLSVMDKRTTQTCIFRNGLVWDKNKNPEGHNTKFALPPLHWHCRSIIVPLLKGYKGLPSSFKKQVPKNKRKKFTLKRANIVTFEIFFKNQTKNFQIEYLGEKRFKLWKQGRLDLKDFINDEDNFLPITKINGE